MKHYTSYYANFNNIPKTYFCVGISRVCPEWFAKNDIHNFMFVKNNFLAPSEHLLNDFKAGKLTQEEYKKIYVTELFNNIELSVGFKDLGAWISAADVHFSSTLDHWDALVFMCYERPEEFCHRHIVRKLLNNVYNVQCDEFGFEPKPTPTKKIISDNTSVHLFE